jgi:AbiV family abortive infection protein
MTGRVKQYRGPLTTEQAAAGIALARKNAQRLIHDAELLLKAERHASASAIAILAIEELGKVQIIKMIALFTDGADLKRLWREYRSHRAKNVQWIIPKLVSEGARTMLQMRPAANIEADHTDMLDAIKQISIYTDCLNENPRWSEPGEAVDQDFAPAILATAKLLNRDEVTTVRELDLWVECVGPHYNKPTMANAVLAFQRQLFKEGLSRTSPEALEAFMLGRPVPVVRESEQGVFES